MQWKTLYELSFLDIPVWHFILDVVFMVIIMFLLCFFMFSAIHIRVPFQRYTRCCVNCRRYSIQTVLCLSGWSMSGEANKEIESIFQITQGL